MRKNLTYRMEKKKYIVTLKLSRAEEEKLKQILKIYTQIYVDYCIYVIDHFLTHNNWKTNFKHYYLTNVLPVIKLAKKDPTNPYYYISTNLAYEVVKEGYNFMIRYDKIILKSMSKEERENLDEWMETVIKRFKYNNFKMIGKDCLGLHIHKDTNILHNLQDNHIFRLLRFGKIKASKKDIKKLPMDLTEDMVLYYYLNVYNNKKGNKYQLTIVVGKDKIYRDEDDFIYLKHKDLIRKEQQG